MRFVGQSVAVLLLLAQPVSAAGADVQSLRDEAFSALGRGDFPSATAAFEKVLLLDPDDAVAAREGGRSAQAMGDYPKALALLTRAAQLQPQKSDPELQFLRGELLYALDRPKEARAAHDLARADLEWMKERNRYQTMWLARIYARQGLTLRAVGLYEGLAANADPAKDAEIWLAWADALVMSRELLDAELVLRDLLGRSPDDPNARGMLAWVLEQQGKLDAEVAVRRALARDAPSATTLSELGRALERSGDFRGARTAYQQASEAASPQLKAGIAANAERMRLRSAPEAAVEVVGQTDPTARSLQFHAGVNALLSKDALLAASGHRDQSIANDIQGAHTGARLSLKVGELPRPRIVAALSMRSVRLSPRAAAIEPVQRTEAGGEAELWLEPVRGLKLQLAGDVNAPWDESAVTLSRAGTVTGAGGTFYAMPFGDRVIFTGGGRAQVLRLATPELQEESSEGGQWMLNGGVDAVGWVDHSSRLRGEVMDESLTQYTGFEDALVLTFRHYEVRSRQNAAFRQWISLVDRASVNEAGLIGRKVFWNGRVGVEVDLGLGHDPVRQMLLTRATAMAAVAPSPSVRLTLRYDTSSETHEGLAGRRQLGSIGCHVDF